MTDVTIGDLRADSVKTPDATLKVSMDDSPLPVGEHRFELLVADDSGNESEPAIVSIVVLDTERPTAVLEVRTAQGELVPNNRLPFGTSFTLDARRSSDAGGGNIISYTWTLLG